MSLSFPVLLSAVPLYAIDFTLRINQPQERPQQFTYTAKRVWFSDGGIASNMPLHFFDAPLPAHPTFAVNLKTPHPDFEVKKGAPACDQLGRVYLPHSSLGGRLRYWPDPDDATPARGLIGFLVGIVNTMQNWRDEIQFPYPGFRDRIVQISQLPDEGGLNLNMPRNDIDALSEAGECAAQRLIARFHPQGQPGGGWHEHQEARLRSFLGVLERMALTLEGRLTDNAWFEVVQRLVQRGVYNANEGRLARECLECLRGLGELLRTRGAPMEGGAPNPKPTLRIAPRI